MSGARLEPAPGGAPDPVGETAGRTALLTDLTGGAAFVVDPALRCLVAQGDAIRLAGLAPDDIVGRPIAELLDPVLAARLEPHSRLALDGHPFTCEHEARGRGYLSRGVPLRDASGAVYAALVVTYDITDRRQADALRRRSEEAFSTLIEHAPFAVYVVDASFRLRAMNHRAEALFHGIESLLGRDFSEIARAMWPEPRAAEVVRVFKRTLATGDAYVAERAGALRGSGRMAAYDWQIQRLTLPDGTTGVVCYAYDLTPIREAERVLTQAASRDAFLVGFTDAVRALPSAREIIASAAARLGQALGASQVAYADVDADTGVATVEDDWSDGAMASTAGRYRFADLDQGVIDELRAGRTLAIADVRADARTQRPEIQAAFARASVAACLDVPLVKAGRLVAVLAVSQAEPRQWLPTELALAQEVAERTWAAVGQARAEARLRDSEARLKLALDASGMGTFVWHVDEGRGEPDTRALELFGITEASPSPQHALETLVHPADRPRCAAAMARALDPAGAGTLHEDIRVLAPGGDVRWLAITARTTFAGQPRRAVRIAGVVADIDDRKQIEASLRQREEALTGADRRKDEFLAMLAHELRNPLAPIRAGLELIRLNGDSRIAVERTRAIMERQVGHMVRLIDDLLDVSRISSGKIHLQRRPTPVDVLVNTAVEANREAITAARLTLDLALPDTPTWLDTDPTRGVQVISNVLHNAVKFTDPGGRIAISARVEDGGGSMLALTITDSGMGISAEMLPRVFDLFTQDRAAGSRSHTGLGIGLALARRLIEMHGGTIEARSDGAGRGSTFIIRLPVAIAGETPPPADSSQLATPRTRHRVVVVDDNVDAANAMAMLIAALGGEARVATDGPGGLAQVLAWSPTLVLLDIGMPGMDGYETCRRIREAMGTRVKVVALTGWAQEQDKRDAQRAGFDAHLTKPADPAALERLLGQYGRPDSS